jgi:catechol 2,3-dioxygenase-like lactoylglutathione lyase family enzyme
MRTIIGLLLIAMAALAEELPITRLAGASFKVADLEKARQFYTGILGLDEAFDLRDASGAIQSVFFKVNDDQYLEFSPGATENFHLEHVSILTADLKKMGAMLETRQLAAGKAARSADGNTYLAIQDPEQIEIRFVRYMPGSQQTEHRGKALGSRRVSDRLQHIGLACDDEAACMALYSDKLGFRELFRGGPTPGEIRWINLAAPGATGDILELMIMASQPAQGRRHIAFEVPDIKRAYKQLVDQGLPDRFKPNPGPKQNHRWILNLRDPNGIRVEFMGEAVSN